MTTPERLRRRQRIETALVAVTMALAAASTVTSSHRNDEQDQCFADQFEKLSRSLTVRGDLNAQDSENLNTVVRTISAARTQDDVRAAFAHYLEQRRAIDHKREQTPIPPYPSGQCE